MISEQAIADAVSQFWLGRTSGTQSAKHDKALLDLVASDLKALGWDTHIAGYANDPRAVVGGHFRPAKSWDIVCRTPDGDPRILVEFKSQVDSYGNNENNRYEEGPRERARRTRALRCTTGARVLSGPLRGGGNVAEDS
jgi:hypothetical protein